MKWALAGMSFLVAIVVFSVAALDQKDVIWVLGKPQCPHCRSEVNAYANVCATCDTAFEWDVHEEPCTACLSKTDAAYYEARAEDREEMIRSALAGRVREVWIEDLVAYATDIEAGECGFCGGTQDWIAGGEAPPVADDAAVEPDLLLSRLREHLDGRCPVCFGDGSCILCGGDHLVVIGREAAAVERARFDRRHEALSPLRDAASSTAWFRLVGDYVRKHDGRREIETLPAADDPAGHQIDRARARLHLVREILDRLPDPPEGS